jgi:hypothetical protein
LYAILSTKFLHRPCLTLHKWKNECKIVLAAMRHSVFMWQPSGT